MRRSDVNQILLNFFENPSYLEIGVDEGATFHSLKAGRKVAVDPHFKFDTEVSTADPANANCEYHPVNSDIYFANRIDDHTKFDVVFIDGLHTFDQTMKDLLNAMSCVADNGIIVVDDVIPSSYAASLPDLAEVMRLWEIVPHDKGSWMGDVFRLVFFVDQYMPFYEYATVQENHGQMIMWRGRRQPKGEPPMKIEDVSRVRYADALLNGKVFNILPMAQILERLPPR